MKKMKKMKKIISVLLVLLMLASFCSCEDPTPDTPAVTTAEESVTAPTEVDLALGEKCEYAFVYSRDDLGGDLENEVLAFRRELRKSLSMPELGINKFGNGDKVAEVDKEILIGKTNRKVSIDLMASVPENCFGIEITENKVAIYAGKARVLISALDYFFENYIKPDSNGNIKLPIGRYISEEQKYSVSPLISEKEGFSTAHTFLFDIPAIGNNKIMQGGCSDGSYMYFCMINSGSPQYAYVCKYDIATNKLVKKSELIPTDHSNDMTYNPKTNELIVLHNSPRNAMLTMLDPETLEIKRTQMVSFNMFCIDYQPERDVYVIGISGGQNFTVLDENFKINRDYIPLGSTRFEANSTGYTTQGVVCDKDYIYFVQYKENVIMVYDWTGKYINKIQLSIPTSIEPENISIVDDRFYIACNNSSWTGGALYSVELIPPEK